MPHRNFPLAILLADRCGGRWVAEDILRQRAPVARSGDERIAFGREVIWNVDWPDIVSVIYTFKLPFCRARAPTERPIDFLASMSSRAHLAGKFYFIIGPRLT
jgi:hypothetical protein